MRSSGILLPVFSLPSEYGVGDLYREAYEFIDKLSLAGQTYWQILPLGPTGEDNCPYQAMSSFAGDPIYISPDKLREQGLLEEADLKALREAGDPDRKPHAGRINYPAVKAAKREALRKAYGRFVPDDSFHAFCHNEREWLEDYALYMALVEYTGETDHSRWPEELKERDRHALKDIQEQLKEAVGYHKWTQFQFFRQWEELKEHARSRQVKIIGDLPYFAAYYSAECWRYPEYFRLDEEGRMAVLAGAPPDAFTEEGQCWGNPVYDWEKLKEEDYSWWISRIKHQLKLFDVVRLDHMRGFQAYYSVPASSMDPKEGYWVEGPGVALFRSLEEQYSENGGNKGHEGRNPVPLKDRIIAEDLGYLTEEVKAMMEATGYPGMKVLQFAFDSGEENLYLPDNYVTDRAVVYTGTHDNDTTRSWYEGSEDWKQSFCSWYLQEKWDLSGLKAYLKGFGGDVGDDRWQLLNGVSATLGMIELAFSSRCETCIIPMQDYLLLGSEGRINVPGRAEDNWGWQMEAGAFTEDLCSDIRKITEKYNRIP